VSYQPTLAKLRTIGAFQKAEPRYKDTVVFEWLQDAHDAPAFEHRAFLYASGNISLCNHGVWGVEGTTDEDGCVFYGTCPNEAFFDQLLIAVGWQPTP
jgi:hypothetical protein